jgi:uncharacterized membrane protein
MTRAYPTRNSQQRQRGAIGLLGVATLLLAVLFTALVVDSGRLWMQQRHLQTVADIASIQAARELTCNVVVSDVLPKAQAAAVANGYTGNLANSPNVVEMVNITTDANGVRQYTSGGSQAVRVYATHTVPASLVVGGLFLGKTVTLNAQAVSRADPAIAAFSAGTFAARIDTENSVLLNALLGDILGSSLSLDVLSYQGIANTHITLNELLAASGQVGGLDSLLDTSMSVADLMDLTASAVSQSGTASASAEAGMNQIASAAVSNANIKLSDILDVATPDEEAAGKVGINALSLVTAAALIANGNSAISLPLAVSVPQIASINAQIDVIQPPKIAVGPIGDADGTICTTLTTAQVEASVNVNTNLTLAGVGVHLDLVLEAAVAQGSAGLSDIQTDSDSVVVTVDANPGIASVNLTNSSGAGGARVYATLPIVGYDEIATLAINLPVQPASAQPLVFDVDYPVADNLPQTQTVASPLGDSLANALDTPIQMTPSSVSNQPLVNAVVNPIINTTLNLLVTPIVKPLLIAIGDAFLEPLFELLGLQLGGMDVTLQGIQMRQPEPLII